MALGAEAFTVLAVLEARDMASEIYERVQGAVERFSGAMKGAADTATAAGAEIDESILQTASGADALDLATAKVQAAQARAAEATNAQAQAERELLAAQQEAAGAADGDAAATDRLTVAAKSLADAQRVSADATRTLRDAQAEQSAISDVQAGTADAAAASNEAAGSKLTGLASTVGKIGLGMGIAGGLMVKSAADFQSSTSVLATSGGETAGELDKARQGILSLAASTGTSTQELTNGLYMLGSAGFDAAHGGLQELQSAAQGAKAENADLGTVSNALSTILTDYGIKVADTAAGQRAANAVMDQMIAVVQNGKTTTEALAGSLSAVLPIASSAKLSFGQVGGAMATMTAQGMSAQQSAQDLAHTISALQSPNAVAVKEMQSLGLNANDVSQNLGKEGLTGTLAQLTGAITSHMGPAGMVIQNAFAASSAAAKDANAMISAMPPNLQKLANSYLAGSVSAKDWKADLQGLDPVSQHLMQQFATTADKTHQFNDLLAAGSPAAQTYNAALSKIMGGQTGLTTALMLTGSHLTTFQQNVATVSGAASKAGASVDGWQQIQGNFNQKLAEAKQSVEVMAISIGTALLPVVSKIADGILKVVAPLMQWIQGHQKLVGVIFAGLAGLFTFVGAVNLAAKAAKSVKGAFDSVTWVLQKLGILSKAAAESQEAAAGSADAMAASADGLAASEEAGAAATAEATAATDAQSASWLASGLAAAGAAVKTVALQAANLAGAAASYVAAGAATALGAAIDFATGPVGLIVIAIVALIGIFVLLWAKCVWFRDFWKGLWRDIEAAAKIVWSALKAAFQDVANFFAGIWDSISSSAHAAWDDLVSVFDGIVDTITTVVGDVLDWVKTHWELLVAILTGPIGIAVGLIVKYWSDIKHWFQDGVSAVDHILDWFTSLPGKFSQWMGEIASAIANGIADVVRWFAGLPGRIVSGIGNLGSLLLRAGSDIISGLWDGVTSAWQGLWAWFLGLGTWILNAVGDLGSVLWDAGKALISGLWSGISSAASGLWSDLTGLGGTIASYVASGLGINSPSTVMADEVGRWIPAGIAVGITDNMGVIANAVKAVGPLTVHATQSGLGTGPPMPNLAAAPASGAGTNVTLNVDLRNSFVANDQAARQLVNQIGDVVAKQIFPQAGFKLATM
jgi:TP901 family phage tail tape measure protein